MKTKMPLSSILMFIFFLEIIIASPVNAVIRIMPVGDSITQGIDSGVSDEDYQISYRKTLLDLLVAAEYDVDFVGSLNSGSAVFGDSNLADHEGHPGWRDDEIVNGRAGSGEGKLEDWLITERPNIVLLHIGTNVPDPSPDDVEDILDLIDNYENTFSEAVWVILARIINRTIYSETTTNFNDNVETMALDRINNPNNLAYPDKIIIVDMEDGANINYNLVTDNPPGDIWDGLHPFETGYNKMADVWFSGLQAILPVADAGSDQNKYEGNTVTLDASNSFDPDGMIVSYFWEQQPGGSPVILSDSTVVKPTFTAPDVGLGGETLTFKVTVTDADGLESTDNTNVDVSDVNVTLSGRGNSVVGDSGGGGCFIATAAYGSLMEPHVKILREFRDRFLITNIVGKSFVNFYYKYSPPLANFIAKHDNLRMIVRITLFPLVGISWISLKLGTTQTMVLTLLFGIGIIGLTRVRRKLRG